MIYFEHFQFLEPIPVLLFCDFAFQLFEMFACIASIAEEIILSRKTEISCSCEHTALILAECTQQTLKIKLITINLLISSRAPFYQILRNNKMIN